jgi:hypothetical protein
MNIWKAWAMVATVALIGVVGSGKLNTAHAAGATTHAVDVAGQPNMEAALASLRQARASLVKAEHDKGGWRAAAVQSTDIAIRETERGIAFDSK